MRKKLSAKADALGPGSYPIPILKGGTRQTFGSRFDPSLGNKNHLRPAKVDGPGPGAYKMPSMFKVPRRREPTVIRRTTFGTAERDHLE